jgi:hypothetical protein
MIPLKPFFVSLAIVLAPTAALADVKVSFVTPDRYSDRDFRNSASRDATLDEFRRYFARLGERYLKPGQSVSIEVLNIDLAGDYEPWRTRFHDVRIMRDVTPPRFKLRYALRQGGRVVLQAEESVSDMNYLMNPSARMSSERYAYEKDMLRDWFRARFVEMRPPRG